MTQAMVDALFDAPNRASVRPSGAHFCKSGDLQRVATHCQGVRQRLVSNGPLKGERELEWGGQPLLGSFPLTRK